jgi:hypothetical protein
MSTFLLLIVVALIGGYVVANWVDVLFPNWYRRHVTLPVLRRLAKFHEWKVQRAYDKTTLRLVNEKGYKLVSPEQDALLADSMLISLEDAAKLDTITIEAACWEQYVEGHVKEYMAHQDPDNEWWRLSE